MLGFLKKLFGGGAGAAPAGNLTVEELARRLGVPEQQLRDTPIKYHTFMIPKRSGGTRTIAAPDAPLKAMQRLILRKLLARLKSHPSATGFEKGYSIVSNALPHVGQDVVIRLDLKDFFNSTLATRIEKYFRSIGWNNEAAALLTNLCTDDGSLPQGAPTSPRLSNLVNFKLDARLSALAQSLGLAYSRYADDITFSGPARRDNKTGRANSIIHFVKQILHEEGRYVLHTDRKLRIARRHDRQLVTGLVVNEKVNLKRDVRRRLRAVEHHLRTGKPATMTQRQLDGWKSLQSMIAAQRSS